MKAAYMKAPHQFEIRDVQLANLQPNEVEIQIKACGFCGHDLILSSYAAEEWQPFGHEFSGVVTKVGSAVTHLQVGDKVAVETSTFNPLSDFARNGRVDLDTKGPNYMVERVSMGFAEYTTAQADLCVKFDDLSFEEACMLEPLGVAMDLIMTADIKLNDDVLVLGLGPIGLMALQMAKASGARKVYAAEFSTAEKRCEMARRFGADDIIYTDKTSLTDYPFPRGGVDRVLVTAPPKTIDVATKVCDVGGIVAFLGISYGPAAVVSFDSNVVHLNKIQIRGSNAIPALYFPKCIDLVKAGVVQLKPLISHTFTLDETPQALTQYIANPANALKAVMVNG